MLRKLLACPCPLAFKQVPNGENISCGSSYNIRVFIKGWSEDLLDNPFISKNPIKTLLFPSMIPLCQEAIITLV
jgi:hypothetical protein